jgi:ribosomal protein S18 acetylase RimI-like enzyme
MPSHIPAINVEVLSHITDEIAHTFQQLVPQLSTTAPPLSRDELEQIIRAPANTVFIARKASSSEVVGTLTLVQMRTPTGVRAWIEDVVVDSSARGLGVGEALVLAGVAHAQEMGARNINLTSNPERPAAHCLYEKAGFAVRDTRVYRRSRG